DDLALTIIYHGAPVTLSLPANATITDLSDAVFSRLSVPQSTQKFLVSPKPGLLRPPFKDGSLPISSLLSAKKITLLGSTTSEISSLSDSISKAARPRQPGPTKPAQPAPTRNWRRASEEAQYTFHTLRPLLHLPNPERSLRFLERLRDDPGVRAAMRRHKFSVGLLTEMNPAEHTTQESRTLGLNRNRGEVIELRLRTDAYDGYRDYRVIRLTLCHELAHNVWGEHDRNFWDLCKRLEKEVARDDWRSGGHAVGDEEFYNPNDEIGDHVDGGGWTGGEFVLGRAEGSTGNTGIELSRRDILARAAEERARKAK
ncbi:WLM domain-containing protein, partial [Lineolata rhizophorae]